MKKQILIVSSILLAAIVFNRFVSFPAIPSSTKETTLFQVVENKKDILSQNLPRFNPKKYGCDDMPPLKPSKQEPTFDPSKYSWQVSAPRGTPGKTFKGDIATLGLRNKYGGEKDTFYFSARVEQPSGSANIVDKLLYGDEWSYQDYPTDFNGGDTSQIGIYTVIYQIHGTIVACDGFMVE